MFKGYRSNNFIVGLTNNNPEEDGALALWNYTLCGQYPGAVPNGATVAVECSNAHRHELHFRYVIVQFPLINEQMNFCEIEVFTIGTYLSSVTNLLEINSLVSINEVVLRHARLLLGCVTVCGQANHLGMYPTTYRSIVLWNRPASGREVRTTGSLI